MIIACRLKGEATRRCSETDERWRQRRNSGVLSFPSARAEEIRKFSNSIFSELAKKRALLFVPVILVIRPNYLTPIIEMYKIGWGKVRSLPFQKWNYNLYCIDFMEP